MWFEVNVRLSEVTDLRWPHGTEWQCGNSTLAMFWSNHVQILSFAPMVSRQGAVKHGFVSKIPGGCSSYDVIAPWPDLTWSNFLPKVAQGLPHEVPQNPAPPFFRYLRKTSGGGGGCTNPLSGRGLNASPGQARVNLRPTGTTNFPPPTGVGGVWTPLRLSRILLVVEKNGKKLSKARHKLLRN